MRYFFMQPDCADEPALLALEVSRPKLALTVKLTISGFGALSDRGPPAPELPVADNLLGELRADVSMLRLLNKPVGELKTLAETSSPRTHLATHP